MSRRKKSKARRLVDVQCQAAAKAKRANLAKQRAKPQTDQEQPREHG